DGAVSHDEYMASRHKAFDRLDSDHDGRLSFAEYAVRTEAKFAKADGDRDGRLDSTEFASTAPKPRPVQRKPCPAGEGAARGEG
ncbi:MAG: EF-hand domain-containing protein, partial [Alphaproteobacteria bacterium]|nr:EF-hand domain-containing protein [Alphaproteobacteria bacterium]